MSEVIKEAIRAKRWAAWWSDCVGKYVDLAESCESRGVHAEVIVTTIAALTQGSGAGDSLLEHVDMIDCYRAGYLIGAAEALDVDLDELLTRLARERLTGASL